MLFTISRRGVVRPWLLALAQFGVALKLVRRFRIELTRRQAARRKPRRAGRTVQGGV